MLFRSDMVYLIADILGVSHSNAVEFINVEGTRPGHDLRYALDGSKLALAGWHAPVPFEESLKRTVLWTKDNPQWLS